MEEKGRVLVRSVAMDALQVARTLKFSAMIGARVQALSPKELDKRMAWMTCWYKQRLKFESWECYWASTSEFDVNSVQQSGWLLKVLNLFCVSAAMAVSEKRRPWRSLMLSSRTVLRCRFDA